MYDCIRFYHIINQIFLLKLQPISFQIHGTFVEIIFKNSDIVRAPICRAGRLWQRLSLCCCRMLCSPWLRAVGAWGAKGLWPTRFWQNPIQTRGQVVPNIILLPSPPWIFRTSYGFPCPRWPPPCPPPTPPPTALTSSHSKPWTLVCTCWLMHQGTWMSSWCVLWYVHVLCWLLSFHERNAKLGIRDWDSYPKIKIQRRFFLTFEISWRQAFDFFFGIYVLIPINLSHEFFSTGITYQAM